MKIVSDKIRVLRITVIEGEREWVEKTVEASIQGTRVVDRSKGNKVHSVTIGAIPEILEQGEENQGEENNE